jgi:Carboxypeptidase regulatory-like domain
MQFQNRSSSFHVIPNRDQRFCILCLALLFVCIFPLPSHAQAASGSAATASAPTGSITGKVSEKHGGPLAGARVSVLNVKTGISSSVATDVNGQFTVENLPVGSYKVTITADGCASQEDKVTIKPGHKSKLSTTLKAIEPQTAPPQ